MKNSTIFLSIMIMAFGLVSLVIVTSKFKDKNQSKALYQNDIGGKKYRIAIMLQVSHPALEEIKQGFVDTLQTSVSCQYDIFNANGDRVLMRRQAEEIVAKNYDLVCTIPTTPSLIMKEVCMQRGKAVPIVATAVEDPVAIKLVESMHSSGNNITAVTGIDTFEQQIDILKFFKPHVRSVLLVYNPTVGLITKKNEVQKICEQKNIKFSTVEIFNVSDLIHKIPNFIHDCDTIIVLKDNVVVSGLESLVTLCNKNNITLYASDLNSGDKGAALCYGVTEYQDGVEAGLKAIEILKHGKQPSEVPSSATSAFKIKINTSTMCQQDLDIKSELLLVMSSGEVI